MVELAKSILKVILLFGVGSFFLYNETTKLIQLSITGYGIDGPYSKRRVYDPLIQATAGIANAQSIDGTPKFVKTLITSS